MFHSTSNFFLTKINLLYQTRRQFIDVYVEDFLFVFFDGGVNSGVFFEEVVEDVFAEETDEFSGLFGDGDVSDFADDVVETVFGDVLFGDGEQVVQLFAV